jgi:hypothetical protein
LHPICKHRPAADGTVAVVKGGLDTAEEVGGVSIYDNGIARPNGLCGFGQFGQSGCNTVNLQQYNSIQWNANASVMFAANTYDTGEDFYTIPVTASGFGMVTDYAGLAGGFGPAIHLDRVTGYVYDDDGTIIDPVAGSQNRKIRRFWADGARWFAWKGLFPHTDPHEFWDIHSDVVRYTQVHADRNGYDLERCGNSKPFHSLGVQWARILNKGLKWNYG